MNKDYLPYLEQYEFHQEEGIFHISSDTTILGMCLDDLHHKTVMDMGCGTGALLFYAKHKNAGKVIGVDMNEKALAIAEKNLSQYFDDYELIHSKVQELKIPQVDAIICNPPFFEVNQKRDNTNYNWAMFDETMSIDDMFDTFRRLLKDNGDAYVLYTADRVLQVLESASKFKFKAMKMRFVHDKRRPYALRVFIKFKRGPITKVNVEPPVYIDEEGLHF